MNKTTACLLLFLILNTTPGFSQIINMNNSTKKIITQGKEAIVSHALAIIKRNMPSLEIDIKDYEIKAWANKMEVIVVFRRLIQYRPLNSGYLEHDIFDDNATPFEDWEEIFYVPTKQEKEKIEFVKKHGEILYKDFDSELQNSKIDIRYS